MDYYSLEAEHHGAVAEQKKNRTKVKVRKQFAVTQFKMNRVVVHVVKGIYGIPPLSRALPLTYVSFYINRFFRASWLKQKIKQIKACDALAEVLKKFLCS